MRVFHTITFPVLMLFPRNVPWADAGGFWSDPPQLSLYVERVWQPDALPVTKNPGRTRMHERFEWMCKVFEGDEVYHLDPE